MRSIMKADHPIGRSQFLPLLRYAYDKVKIEG